MKGVFYQKSYARPRCQHGFTLVEMVAVIVLLSFGLIGGAQFFRITAESYRDTSTRAKLTQDGRFVIERISRELREALPGSVRTSTIGTTQCIEWVPVVAASRYLNLPTMSSADRFTVMKISQSLPSGAALFAAVFPIDANLIYDTASTSSPLRRLNNTPINLNGESDANTDVVYLAAATQFSALSPSDRVLFATRPVAVCARNNGDLVRLDNYGFVASAANVAGGTLMAENVLQNDGGAFTVFNVSGATLTRNAMVELNIRIQDARTREILRLQHTVFIRNVP